MFCSNCGSKNPDTGKFCNKCGTKLNQSGTAPATPIAPEAPEAPIEPETQAPDVQPPAEQAAAPKPKKKAKGIAIVLVLLALLLVGGGIAAWQLGLFDGAKTTTAEPLTWQEHYDLAIGFVADGDFEQAIAALAAAIDIDPMQPDVYLELASIYLTQEDTVAAIEILEEGYIQTEDVAISEMLATLHDTDADADADAAAAAEQAAAEQAAAEQAAAEQAAAEQAAAQASFVNSANLSALFYSFVGDVEAHVYSFEFDDSLGYIVTPTREGDAVLFCSLTDDVITTQVLEKPEQGAVDVWWDDTAHCAFVCLTSDVAGVAQIYSYDTALVNTATNIDDTDYYLAGVPCEEADYTAYVTSLSFVNPDMQTLDAWAALSVDLDATAMAQAYDTLLSGVCYEYGEMLDADDDGEIDYILYTSDFPASEMAFSASYYLQDGTVQTYDQQTFVSWVPTNFIYLSGAGTPLAYVVSLSEISTLKTNYYTTTTTAGKEVATLPDGAYAVCLYRDLYTTSTTGEIVVGNLYQEIGLSDEMANSLKAGDLIRTNETFPLEIETMDGFDAASKKTFSIMPSYGPYSLKWNTDTQLWNITTYSDWNHLRNIGEITLLCTEETVCIYETGDGDITFNTPSEVFDSFETYAGYAFPSYFVEMTVVDGVVTQLYFPWAS